MKDELEGKEGALDKEHNMVANLQVERTHLKGQLDMVKKEKEAQEKLVEGAKKEKESLNTLIKMAEEERKKMQNEYEKVISERDIFGTQLIRRNDELALLYEKIKILQSTLSKGEIQYQQRMEDIGIYKNEIAKLKGQLVNTNK